MKLFVVGDIHGCFYTALELLSHWDPSVEILVQVGDLIDRGLHSGKVIEHFRSLQKQHGSNKVICLLGNHEQEFLKFMSQGSNPNWLRFGGDFTLESFENEKIDMNEIEDWVKAHALKYETDSVFISHAGITSVQGVDPYQLDQEESIIWTRSILKNINKLQIVGHTPMRNGKPFHSELNNVWYIDTGVFLRLYLTGLKVSATGEILETIQTPTKKEDLP